MIAGKVSAKFIIEKLYRDLGINEEIPEEDIYEWVGEAILFIGAFGQFESRTYKLQVENHTACLPPGFYKLQEITYQNNVMYWGGNSLLNNWCCEDCSFPVVANNNVAGGSDNVQNTFYIDNYILHTAVEQGEICITYLSMGVDEEGFPLIPDDVYCFEACSAYVTKKIDWQLWRKGRIPDKVKDDSEARWNFYVQAARGAINMPDAAGLENLKNRLVRIVPQQYAYSQLFRRGQEQRYIK